MHYKFDVRSFDGQGIIQMLREIRATFRPDTKLTILWDNSIHRSVAARRVAERDRHMELLFNIPYRPDLMGIEHVWCAVKARYRAPYKDSRPPIVDGHRKAWSGRSSRTYHRTFSNDVQGRVSNDCFQPSQLSTYQVN